MNLENILRPIVCVALIESGAHKNEILKFLSLSKKFHSQREYFMQNYCFWKIEYKIFEKNCKKIKKLILVREIPLEIDFSNLIYFRCDDFNQPIKDFGNLRHFQCKRFNQRIESFGKLTHFICSHFFCQSNLLINYNIFNVLLIIRRCAVLINCKFLIVAFLISRFKVLINSQFSRVGILIKKFPILEF